MLPDSRDTEYASVRPEHPYDLTRIWELNGSFESSDDHRESSNGEGFTYGYVSNWHLAICNNYIMFLWNSSNNDSYYDYSFLNFGSKVADRLENDSTKTGNAFNNYADNESPIWTTGSYLGASYGAYNTSYSSDGRRINNLTSMDILYNLLNNLYIPQWRTNRITRKVVDLESIIYHGAFDSKFDLNIKYDIDVKENTLLSFGEDSYLNKDSIKALLIKSGKFTDVDKIIKSVENNITVKTNIETSVDNEFLLSYSVGKTLDLNKQYSKILQMSTEGFDPGKSDVYADGSISTLDDNGVPFTMDGVYIKTITGFEKYSGSLTFPNGVKASTNPEYFKIMSSFDRKKPVMITINPKLEKDELCKTDDRLDAYSLTSIYLGEVIYYNNRIWDEASY